MNISGRSSRRSFLRQSAATGAIAGLADMGFLAALNPVWAEEARTSPNAVRFTPEIEPLVRLIEDTQRPRLMEEVGRRVQRGLPYRDVVTAIHLAAIRNIQPRPDAGFKFHSALVVNAAHQASMASPPEHRWLPIFYALDYFKETQAKQQQQGAWTMGAAKESALPSASHARQAFIEAMDHNDEVGADAAATTLARTAGAQEIAGLFYRYGARGFRDWHHSIYVANSLRLLNTIGWQHAEPILRSLAYALISRDADAKEYARTEGIWLGNQERAARMRGDWPDGRIDSGATRDLLATLREGSAEDAAAKTVELSKAGIGPQSLWDALLVRSVEMLLCQRGFVALHAVTATSALLHAWQESGDDGSRRQLLLYSASFLALFRESMHRDVKRAGPVKEMDLEKLEPAALTSQGADQVGEILSDVSGNRLLAARKLLSFSGPSSLPTDSAFFAAARAMIFLKGNEPHDYKFSESVFEDYRSISPAWRSRYLAASVFWLRGTGPDSPLVARTRAALQG